MSIKVMTRVWEMDLPAKDKLVLLALADCANDEGLAWPSIATLARKCGCDQRTIQRNLRHLEKAGILLREEALGKGCKYRFTPRQNATPDKSPPRQNDGATKTTQTPGKLPPKPSRTVNTNTQRARRLPDDWMPGEFKSGKCREIIAGWSDDERDSTIEHFTAHHRAKGTVSLDWQDSWATWVLNSRRWGNRSIGPPANSNRPQRGSSIASLLDDVRQVHGL